MIKDDQKVVIVVFGPGMDAIAGLVSETETMVTLAFPCLMALNPEQKAVRYVDFLPHAKREAKEAVTFSRTQMLTFYEANDGLAYSYRNALREFSLAAKGIVLAKNEPPTIIT